MTPEEACNQFLIESAHELTPRPGYFVIVMHREPQVGQCGIEYLDPERDFPSRESARDHLDRAIAEGRCSPRDGWTVVPEFNIHEFSQHYVGRTN